MVWRREFQSPGRIARRLELATPMVTKMTTRMEAGLVEQLPHPTDRQLVRICLTERGTELPAVIDEAMRAITGARSVDAGATAAARAGPVPAGGVQEYGELPCAARQQPLSGSMHDRWVYAGEEPGHAPVRRFSPAAPYGWQAAS